MLLGMATLPSARALVIFGGATGHTTNPGGGLPWANVGNTGIYLGAYNTGYWIITANHVGSASIILGGVTYVSIAGSAQQIGSTDLLLYRINVSGGAPALSNLTISANSPIVGQPVVMIGDGSGTMTWGNNNVDRYGLYTLETDGPQTYGLFTTYSSIAGEAQAQGGDSGGALFYQTATDTWQLNGILSGIGTSGGIQFTASVATSFYYSQIVAIVGIPLAAVPEPAAWATLLGSAALLGTLLVRRRGTLRTDNE